MICPLSVGRDCDGDAGDAEEHEDQGPPCEVGEAAVDGGYYGADKGYDPGELLCEVSDEARQPRHTLLTMPMDMVARAKGSPMMRPRLKPCDLWP